jgi:hypothetical protein
MSDSGGTVQYTVYKNNMSSTFILSTLTLYSLKYIGGIG